MIDHQKIRRECKVACACSDGEIKLKDLAEYVGITEHAFYNYIAGQYEISEKKAKKLHDIVIDWIEY